jgi:hypothetical protein
MSCERCMRFCDHDLLTIGISSIPQKVQGELVLLIGLTGAGMVAGALAPYLALPLSLGIVAGAIFHVLRVVVYGLILMIAGTRTLLPEHNPSK